MAGDVDEVLSVEARLLDNVTAQMKGIGKATLKQFKAMGKAARSFKKSMGNLLCILEKKSNKTEYS